MFQASTFADQQPIKNRYFFKKGTSSKEILFQKSYFLEKANFSEKYYYALPTLSGEQLFQSGEGLTFHSKYFFRGATFSKHTFSEGSYFTATFSFYSSLPIYELVIKLAWDQFSTVKCGSSFKCVYYC